VKLNHGRAISAQVSWRVEHWLESFDAWLVQQGFGAKASR